MQNEPEILALEIAELERWLSDPNAPLSELLIELSFLRTDAEARRYLDDIREGLADVKCGRLVPHERILRDAEERRQRYRATAAE